MSLTLCVKANAHILSVIDTWSGVLDSTFISVVDLPLFSYAMQFNWICPLLISITTRVINFT